MYASNIMISFSSNSLCTINKAVSEDLLFLKTWLYEKKLSLNVAKTHSLLIGSRYNISALERPDSFQLFLSIGNKLISSVTDTKYLGLQIGQYLNWEQHVLLITKNISNV